MCSYYMAHLLALSLYETLMQTNECLRLLKKKEREGWSEGGKLGRRGKPHD